MPPDPERLLSLVRDQDGCRLLLAAIFDPPLYHAYRELRSCREAGGAVAEACGGEKGEGDHTGPDEIVEPGASNAVGFTLTSEKSDGNLKIS